MRTRPRLVSRVRPSIALIIVFVALGIIPLVFSDNTIGVWTFALSFAIAAVGLNLLIADAGLVSLGQNAFFAFGAYVTTALVSSGWSYLECLGAVIVASLVLGWCLGPPIVKLGHLNFALITIGLGFVTPTIVTRLEKFTGGASGRSLPPVVAPLWSQLTSVAWLYYMGLIVLLACTLLVVGIKRSQAGRALRAQRDNDAAAEAFGVQVVRLRCGAFAMSVMMAGIGGWLWSMESSFVAPDSFNLTLSISLLAGVVVSGLGYSITPILAGVFVQFLPQFSASINPAFGGLIQGCIIVIILMVAGQGVVGLLVNLLQRVKEFAFPLRDESVIGESPSGRS